MAKLVSKHRVKVNIGEGDPAVFVLRQPTNEEINKFNSEKSAFKLNKKSFMSHAEELRCKFFDKLLIEVGDLVDEGDVPITVERKELIPSNAKTATILELFESVEAEVDGKN